jgi:hypothetical protein
MEPRISVGGGHRASAAERGDRRCATFDQICDSGSRRFSGFENSIALNAAASGVQISSASGVLSAGCRYRVALQWSGEPRSSARVS